MKTRFPSCAFIDAARALHVPRITSHTDRGFIALTSVILIGAMLTVLVFTAGATTFFSRHDTLAREHKRASLALAEACVGVAMLNVARNSDYVPAVGGDCVSLDGTCAGGAQQNTCKICSMTPIVRSFATTTVRALYRGAYTNIVAGLYLAPGNLAIVYWEEVGTHDGPSCPLP